MLGAQQGQHNHSSLSPFTVAQWMRASSSQGTPMNTAAQDNRHVVAWTTTSSCAGKAYRRWPMPCACSRTKPRLQL